LRIWGDALKIEMAMIRHRLSDRKTAFAFLRLILVLIAILLLGAVLSSFFLREEGTLSLVEGAGAFGPLLIILLIVLEVLIAPLPGAVIMLAAGYLYGIWLGALYSYIGNVLGSLLAFALSRNFGRPFVERILSKETVRKYDGFFKRRRHHLIALYALPIIPVDILSFICGLSSLTWRRFLLVVSIGFIPNTLLLSFLGNRLQHLDFWVGLVFVVAFLALFFLFAWVFRVVSKHLQERRKNG
jgi:uncharacterized membrane protein YdjX (TVP38/TMEM64 family)